MFLLTEEQLKYLLIKNSHLPLHLEKSQHALARTWGKHQISSCQLFTRYQLNAQYFLYSHNITLLYTFQAITCCSSGGQIVYIQHLVSSLSIGECGGRAVHLCTARPSRSPIYIQFDLLRMSILLLKTCRGM
jgi:hypothetical protein